MADDKIAECFPGREIISVACKDLPMEGGALRCIAMHQPKELVFKAARDSVRVSRAA